MSGFRYLLVLESGEPADPPSFVVGEPAGRWSVGDRFFTAVEGPDGMRAYRILDIQGAPEEPNGQPWAGEANAVWTVEPV